MRNLETLNRYRLATNEIRICGTTGDSGNGIFLVRVKGKRYYVVASDGGGWDHVSIYADEQPIRTLETLTELGYLTEVPHE